MRRHLQNFKEFIKETVDPTYYQETFYFTILLSMGKELGGSRDQTKNDIRALPEILTVTLVEEEKGGVQRDLGTKYLSTLKLHARLPKGASKEVMMKRLVLLIGNLRGVSVLRYKEKKPKQRRKAFHGSYKITEGDYWQSAAHKKNLRKDSDELTTAGGKKKGKGGTPFKQSHNVEGDWESAPPTAPGGLEETALDEDVIIKIGRDDLMAFDIQGALNQKIWAGDSHVRAGVKGALMDIVDEFLEGLDMDLDIKDIVITGSVANYNWSKFSDIDIHILVDFADVNDNEEMVKKFFDAVRANWNKLHTILVKGHEVEIYVQDEHEPHVSPGVYSLKNNRWLIKPTKVKPEIDRPTTIKKMKQITREIDKLSLMYDNRHYEGAFELAERIKKKIKRMRRNGLERAGVYAPENLAFKMLRRSGDIEQLFSIYTQAYDKLYSLDQ
jgi:predicted nucleotidyltransferase